VVDEDLCVGCVQCSIDCPYGAITMFERTSRRSDLVARVNPDLCVSCGICAGSCAPMGVGPPGRAGRDQMVAVREFAAAPGRRSGEIVVISCDHGAGKFAADVTAAGGVPYPIDCAGNLHTSVVEILLRGKAGGVLILACPSRDCWNREGPRWLGERVYGGREAELQPRVERARVRIVNVDARDRRRTIEAVRAFAAEIAVLGPPVEAEAPEAEAQCEPALAESDS
jgi:coenzyme F420-reducing hydrogenase delta subunit/NAD-dependent dihydropyrimidine dehydrogenase PreA subunit